MPKSAIVEEDLHAELSPSGAHRWMACPGSVVLEANEPDEESEYALEGTLAHALAAHCLKNKLDTKGILMLPFRGKDEIIPMDMREHVQEYLDIIRKKAKGNHLLIEQKLDLEPITGEKDAKGTSDSVIIENKGTTMDIPDFKYGMGVKVYAKNNPQTRIYALAALDQFDALGDFEKVRLGIHQPRLDHFDEEEVTVEELRLFQEEVTAAVARVAEAKKSNSLAGYLHPGDKQCKFCKAKAKCPALGALVTREAMVDYDDDSGDPLPEPVDLKKAMDKVDLIEVWCKAIRAKMEAELLTGRKIPGWKLVEGKLGYRKWRRGDAETAKDLLKLGCTEDDIYEVSLRSPTQLEKKIKKTKPKILTAMEAFWGRKPGEPSVAKATDPRPEYTEQSANDYEDVSNGKK